MIGAMEDLTAQRQLEDELRQAHKLEAIGQLAGGVAHDFNNLLTVINGNIEFLRSDLSADLPTEHPAFGDVEQIAHAAERARSLVRQLLTFSRKQPVRLQRLDAGTALRNAETLLRRVIGEEIQLAVHVSEEASHAMVLIDPGQFDQVLMNLAVNGRDAMLTALHGHPGAGGTLDIELDTATLTPAEARALGVASAGRWLRLRVRDTGHGMDATTRSRAFEPFYTTKSVGTGTGLGLSTVFGIVIRAGGAIDVESAPGRGTTFTVLLPMDGVDGTDGKPDATTIPARGADTVLLVEDEALVRAVARRILERHGYTVLEARHGADALLVWRTHRAAIAAVVTDLRMPEMGGRELVAQVRGMQPELPVVFLSGYSDEAAPTPDGPHDAFVHKPFTSETLLSALGRVLDSAHRPGNA
jgi:nitrogen-specific signal transduction histidine kinase/CheY-like chemotaxis protein